MYKQRILDKKFKSKKKYVQEAIGFYWAMTARDYVPFACQVLKEHLYLLQESDDDGNFPNPATDDNTTCFSDFQDYMDVASVDASLKMQSKYRSDSNLPKNEFNTKAIIVKNAEILKDNASAEAINWYKENRKDFLKQAMWNFDDEMEAFAYGMKRMMQELIGSLMNLDSDDHIHGGEIHWKATVSEIYEKIDIIENDNKGLPTKIEEADPHSEETLDLIAGATASGDYLEFLFDFLGEEE